MTRRPCGPGPAGQLAAARREDLDTARFGGAYELVGVAGSGGMGVVYEAIQRSTGSRVALKVISGRPNVRDTQRFVSEVSALERLDHPAIVHHVDHGETTAGEAYLAMDWLVGSSLGTRLGRGPLSVLEAATMGERIADALAHAHGHGIVHRDLKPSNIFLVGDSVAGACLIDFGVAKLSDRELTTTGQMIGTPGYMAPEQVRGERGVDQRVDLFAFGCVLFRALAGRQAFEGAEVMEILARLLLQDPPLDTLVPEVPPRLAHLVGSLLSKHAADRLGDAAVARDELRAIRQALATDDRRALALRPDNVPTPRPSAPAFEHGTVPDTARRRMRWLRRPRSPRSPRARPARCGCAPAPRRAVMPSGAPDAPRCATAAMARRATCRRARFTRTTSASRSITRPRASPTSARAGSASARAVSRRRARCSDRSTRIRTSTPTSAPTRSRMPSAGSPARAMAACPRRVADSARSCRSATATFRPIRRARSRSSNARAPAATSRRASRSATWPRITRTAPATSSAPMRGACARKPARATWPGSSARDRRLLAVKGRDHDHGVVPVHVHVDDHGGDHDHGWPITSTSTITVVASSGRRPERDRRRDRDRPP